MKVVHLARRAFPQKGGVETHLKNLIEVGRSTGDHWILITQQENEKDTLYEKTSWGEVYRIPRSAKSKRATWRWVIHHKFLFEQADIVHVHDIFWWILPVYPSLRKKVCTTFHGWEGVYPVPKKNILQRRLFSLLSKKVIHVGAWIQEFYGDTPNVIMYGACSLKPKSKHLKYKPKKDASLHLVFYGRLEPENEIQKYCNLISFLREKIPVEMTWVGDGSLRSVAEKYGRVTGMVDDPATYFEAADFVCTNSYLSMFRAAASGKIPICVYSHVLKKRYLESFPLADKCIISSTVSHICDQLLELLSNDSMLLTQQTEIAKRASEFTWESVAQQYRGLWHSLVGKPTILHSAHTLGMGGAESFNLALLSELRKNTCEIWGVSNFKPYLQSLAEDGVPTIKQPFVVDVIGDWKGLVKAVVTVPLSLIWYVLLHLRFPDVSTLILSGFPEKILWSPVAKLFGARVIWIEFAPLTSLRKKHFGVPLFFYQLTARAMDSCIVPTQYTLNEFKKDKILPVDKMTVIPCGSSLLPVKTPQITSEHTILCISRFEMGKGQEVLLEAFSHLIQVLPEARLVLIGTGDALAQMKDFSKKLSISESVTFTGWVPSIVPFLDTAQVLVFPSYWSLEGFGMTQIEAFARGVPVVAAQCGPAQSIIKHNINGLLVEPQNAEALAETLKKLCTDNRLRTKLALTALKDYTSTYSIQAVGKQYSQFLSCGRS